VYVQDFRWDKGGTVRAEEYTFFYGKGNEIINWEQNFYTTEQYRQLKEYIYNSERWPVSSIFLNAHALTEEKNDDSMDGIYEEL
jgi:hypothetical protein